MQIQINIDTREALSAEDKGILRAIGFMDGDDEAAPAASKPAAKKTAAKKAAASKPKVADDFPTDEQRAEAAPAAEAVVETKPTVLPDAEVRAAATARASVLLAAGERDRVLKALQAAGAGRVGEVADDKIGAFLRDLSDDDAA